MNNPDERSGSPSMMDRIIRFCLEMKIVVFLLIALVVVWGIMVAPFDWDRGIIGMLPRDPVPVDAIPDIGENQQIVFTEWPGRSPQDIEDQVSYPLTVSLLGNSRHQNDSQLFHVRVFIHLHHLQGRR